MTSVAVPDQRAAGSAYAELSRLVKRAGLLDRRTAYYAVKIPFNLVLLAATITAFVLLGESWYQLIVAACLAVVFTQLAFVGHDAGHKQIFRRGRPNALIGLLHGNLLTGLSYHWWVDKHNRHHAHPNQEDHDPDIGDGAVAFLERHAAGRGRVGRYLAQFQAFLFFPMMVLEALNLRHASIKAVARGRVKNRPLEAVLLTVHVAGYVAALLLVLSPVRALIFFAIHQGLFGVYLGSSFAPNHKGMPILTERDNADFLSRQVLTSRNVTGGRIIDFALGGLNYQIEHHLFPSMPRPSLRRSTALIRSFCEQRGLPYTESTLFASYGIALRYLHSVGAAARPAKTG